MRKQLPNIKITLLCIFLLQALAACGFQLRGDYDLDTRLGKTRLQLPDPNSDFARKLERSLERAGVQLVTDEQADSIIDVSKANFTREVLSIGNDARVREFRLQLEVEFSVLDDRQATAVTPTDEPKKATGDKTTDIDTVEATAIRLSKQVLKQQRDLRFDAGRVLATSRESEFLQEDMSEVLVSLFLQRLAQLEPLK